MPTSPQVLLVGGTDMLRLEMQVLADHNGVTLLTVDHGREARGVWQTAPLALVTADAANGCMDLPSRQIGELVLVAGDDQAAAFKQGDDLGCGFVIDWTLAAPWVGAQMLKVHAAGNA